MTVNIITTYSSLADIAPGLSMVERQLVYFVIAYELLCSLGGWVPVNVDDIH